MELLVAIGLLGLLVALALPNLDRAEFEVEEAMAVLVGDLRMARANATSRRSHYRVTFSSASYTIQRLQDSDGTDTWLPEGDAQTVQLPNGVSLSQGAGETIEFTTRGLVTRTDGTPAPVVTVQLNSTAQSASETVEIWPSGQLQRE